MLRRRGENLSPLEVEEAIQAHPDVVECAVVGVAVRAVRGGGQGVRGARPGPADFAALRDVDGARLSAFKVPRYWQQLDALPRTPTAARRQAPAAGRPPGDERDMAGDIDKDASDD